jgi:hypothetical protein
MFTAILILSLVSITIGGPQNYRYMDHQAYHQCMRCTETRNMIFLLRSEIHSDSIQPWQCMLRDSVKGAKMEWVGWFACHNSECPMPIKDSWYSADLLDCDSGKY